MRIFTNILALIHFSIFFKNILSQTITPDDIKNCGESTTKMFCYGQCITISTAANCAFCEGTFSTTCTKPTVTVAACNQPGFLLNVAGACVDCRSEDSCLYSCDGFWDRNLKACLRQKHKTFKVSSTGTWCNTFTTQADCNKCRDQQYTFSNGKCVKCPYWNSTTMACTTVSPCNSSFNGYGMLADKVSCNVCYNDVNKYLDFYSNTCVACPIECNSCGAYSNCLSCKTNFVAPSDNLGVCECKGAFYFDGTNCVACTKTGCSKCKISGDCGLCQTGMGIDLSTGTGNCVTCGVFNATNALICDIPALKFCLTKSSDNSYCLECQSADQIYDTQLKYCICKEGKVQNMTTGACTKCSDTYPNCATCNTTVCLTCKDPNQVLSSDQKSCICSGFMTGGQCYQCTSSLSNCQSCNSTGTVCTQCQQTYGLNSTTQTCYSCISIDANCITCDGAKKCTLCTNGYALDIANNKCVCDTTTSTRALLNGICNLCSNSITSCSKCQVNATNSALTCIECQSPYVSVNGACQICSEGFYRSGNSCIACTISNCKSCTATDCYSCKAGFTLSNNTCNCIAPMIVDSDGVCKTCANKFTTLCTSCSVSACITCGGTNYTPNSTGCQCLRGVNDAANSKCYACPPNCSACTSNAGFTTFSCTQCDANYKLLSDNTCGQCTSNQYYNVTTKLCSQCNEHCSGCQDNQNGGQCTGCLSGFILNSGACQCSGSKVISTDGINCLDCSAKYDAKCATCDTNSCLTCQTNYYLNGSKVCITCIDGQYFQQATTSCTACSAKCAKCSNLTGSCTQCNENYNLNVSSGIGICECANTKVLNTEKACVLCSTLITNCDTCSSANTCTTCTESYKMMNNGTCDKCKAAQYYKTNTKTCETCPPNCSQCSDDTAQCSGQCNNNYRLENGACVCTKDRIQKENNCKSCSELFTNCQECNTTQCQVCAPLYILTAEGCKPCKDDEIYIAESKSCAPCKNYIKNCKSCTSTTICTQCIDTTFKLSDDQKQCLCPTGNYLVAASQPGNDDQCIPCKNFDQQCLACSSVNVCTLCTDSYAYDSQAKICRQCKSNEIYINNPGEKIQKCTDCNSVHSKCIQCSDLTTCKQCTDNFDINSDNSCQCAGNKVLVPNPNNSNQTICKLCSGAVDPFCQTCISPTQCSKCFTNYRWELTRCIPDINISITSSKQNSNTALGDTYNMSIIIPGSFSSASLKITVHFFDSIEDYNTEVNSLKSSNISEEAIPFSFKNSIIFTQDNLITLPHPKYTKTTTEDGQTFLKRLDTFILHEGKPRFVFAIESQNLSFVRYSSKIDITTTRLYKNMKELSFAIGKQLTLFSQFSLYQIFYQINTHQSQICANDEQCNGNGTCQAQDKMCKCNTDFQLFDCSDYVTFTYDQILEKIGKTLIVSHPVSYQEKQVSKYLPLLTTSTAETSYSGVIANLNAIQDIIKNDIIDNAQREDLENLMQNVMNTVSQNIKKLETGFTSNDILKTIKQLEDITVQLLTNFDNKVGFTTKEMQLLAKISRDPTRLISNINVKNAFDVNFDTVGALFEPTTYESVGLQVKMLRYSFKINPHKLSLEHFKDQPRIYPLVIYHTYRQNSTVNNKRSLQSNAPLNIFAMNITFTFEVNNPSSLTNLICLSLKNLDSDEYKHCQDIQILSSQVICTCENSATLYEDINYNYLPKIEESEEEGDKAPLSMVITIIVLSVLLALLLIIQIRGRRNNKSSAKLDEAYAKSRAAAIAARKRQQELEQNPMNTELKEVRKTMQESQGPQYGYNHTKSEDYRNYDTIFQQSPVVNVQRNVKLMMGGNEETEPDNRLFEMPKLDFYGTDKDKKIEEHDIESETPQKPYIDVNLVTPAMEQKFNDSNLENKNQRGSIIFDESQSQAKGKEQSQTEIENKQASIIKFEQDDD